FGFILGLLPGVDNFSNMGGFLAGLLLGLLLMPSTPVSRKYTIVLWTLRVVSLVMFIVLWVVMFRRFNRELGNR
ncbi:hypothetical protein DFQ30_006114, partial [Apophysomyces sp. BC1015]